MRFVSWMDDPRITFSFEAKDLKEANKKAGEAWRGKAKVTLAGHVDVRKTGDETVDGQ